MALFRLPITYAQLWCCDYYAILVQDHNKHFRLPKIQEKPDSLHHLWMRVNIMSTLRIYHWHLNTAQSDIPGRS